MEKTAAANLQSSGNVVARKSRPASPRVTETFARGKDIPLEPSLPAPDAPGFTADESKRFLHIIGNCAQIQRHYELYLLMRGELQYFIPHQILISASGDFRGSGLTVDVISGLPGVRTEQFANCSGKCPEQGIARLLKRMHGIWRKGGRQPMVLNNAAAALDASCKCDCGLRATLQNMKSIVVHGVHDKRDGYDSLYLALNTDAVVQAQAMDRFCHMVNVLVPQIDFAFRRLAAWTPADAPAMRPRGQYALSAREREIMTLICKGKTNMEIAAILGISANTVKNHAHRIFPKLRASNRTQAVDKFRAKEPAFKNNAG